MRCSFCSKTITIHSRPMHLPGQTVNVVCCPTHGQYSFILLETPIVKFNNSRSTMCIVCGKPIQPTETWFTTQHSSTKRSYAVYSCEHCGSLNQADLTWRI